MRYLIKPRDVQGYRFLSFAKNMGKHLSNKYGQKNLDSTKKLLQKGNLKNIRSIWQFNW